MPLALLTILPTILWLFQLKPVSALRLILPICVKKSETKTGFIASCNGFTNAV